jgi:TrpR-related protein YerC/YecD
MSTNDLDSENLFEAILALENKDEAKSFFRDLLTESEIKEFSSRWKAAQMLEFGKSYTAIVRETGLSSTTVARIAKWLNGELGGYKRAITKMHHHTSSLPGKRLI